MKKILTILLIVSLLAINTVSAIAYPGIQTRMFIDGNEVFPGQEPYNYNGRMYMQAEILANMLGMTYRYNPLSSSLTIFDGTNFISTTAGSNVVVVNSMLKNVDGLAIFSNGMIMLSIRNVAECTGKYVEWNESERAIYIYSADPNASKADNEEPENYPSCDIPDFGDFSKTECDYNESVVEPDGSTTYTYKYIVSRYNMYASGVVQNYLNKFIELGWITDGQQHEVPEENMMYYYFEKGNCHAAVTLIRDAAENVYTLWVTYTVY